MTGQLDLFRALADPTRMRIVHLLRAMELAVGEIALVVDQSQPRVSRHVRILVEAGLVDRRKEGSWVFLSICSDSAAIALSNFIDAAPLSPAERAQREADLARLTEVRTERARMAEQYFAEHAVEWDALRSLHVPEVEVEAAMEAMLKDAPLGRLIDIGTGTGRIATLLAPKAEFVLGVDRSAEMLRLARGKRDPLPNGNVRFVAGDFYALPVESGSADTAILHQVLHYAQEPDRVIDETARALNDGGRLLIVDFAPHQREELRTRDAHARLGFSDRQMEGWFAAASMDLIDMRTLPGGALTVKLWLGRRKAGSGDCAVATG